MLSEQRLLQLLIAHSVTHNKNVDCDKQMGCSGIYLPYDNISPRKPQDILWLARAREQLFILRITQVDFDQSGHTCFDDDIMLST